MEMGLNGVATRKGATITEELCGTRFSRSTVSQLCTALDARVQAWNERSLDAQVYPFGIVDALVGKVRRDKAVRATSALIVSGVNAQGRREMLGLSLGDSESEGTWTDMLAWLKRCGLHGVEVLVSDDHAGLVKAAPARLPGGDLAALSSAPPAQCAGANTAVPPRPDGGRAADLPGGRPGCGTHGVCGVGYDPSGEGGPHPHDLGGRA